MGIIVFISYSRKDSSFENRLFYKLQEQGIQIWVDHVKLTPGTPDWDTAIRRGIQDCDAVILIASPDSRESHFVRDELLLADKYKRPIYPIWAKGEDWVDCVPVGRGSMQYIDARGSLFEQGLNKLLDALSRLDNSRESVYKAPPINHPNLPPPISVRTAVSPQDIVTSPPLVKRIVATPIIQNRPTARNLGTFIGGCLGIILGAYIGGAIVGPQLSVGVLGSTGGISGSRSVGLDFGVLIGCILGLIIGAFIFRFMDHDHTDTNTAKIVSRTFGVGLFGLIFGSIVGGVAGGTIGSIVGSDIGVICGGIIGAIIGYFSD